MDDLKQAMAYAAADFETPHGRVPTMFAEFFPGMKISGHILDLGRVPIQLTKSTTSPPTNTEVLVALIARSQNESVELPTRLL